MLLNKPQAEAVYNAMCALYNVGGVIKASFGNVDTAGINVYEESGYVTVVSVRSYGVIGSEVYASQNLFAAAYGLV